MARQRFEVIDKGAYDGSKMFKVLIRGDYRAVYIGDTQHPLVKDGESFITFGDTAPNVWFTYFPKGWYDDDGRIDWSAHNSTDLA